MPKQLLTLKIVLILEKHKKIQLLEEATKCQQDQLSNTRPAAVHNQNHSRDPERGRS